MSQVTPETIFVFYSLEAILCGLLSFGLVWVLYQNRALRADRHLILVLGAISALGLAFFVCSSLGFYEFYFQQRLVRQNPENVAFSFFLLAILLFGASFHPSASLRSPPVLLLIMGLVLGVADLLWRRTEFGRQYSSFHWIAAAFLLTLLLVSRWKAHGHTPHGVLFFVFLGLVLSFLFFFVSEQYPIAGHSVSVWAGEHLTILGSLIALAHVVELDTQDLFVKSFIRLNLTFVLLAGLIILLVTGMERQAYAQFSAREASDLIEFLRGHVMYFDSLGEDSRQILNNPEITRRIVSDFGRLPDLRRVSVRLNEYHLSMSIDSQGAIDRSLEQEPVQIEADPPLGTVIEGNTLGLIVPVFVGKDIKGLVKIIESLSVMNRRIAYQIMIIFSAFTIVVIFGSILVGIIVTQADATIHKQYGELEATERQLFQAAKLAALGEMAGGVAHEINNPLGVILGRAEYLIAMAKLRQADDFVEDLEVLQRNASRTARIISDLLDFARVHKLNRNPHDINTLISDTMELMASRAKCRDVRLLKKLSPLPMISVDWHQMQQVFVNLINNAVDASQIGGAVHLQTRYDLGRSVVEIDIEDHGSGIPAEHLKKIFDPFFTTKEEGTGLGLSISYRIVRDHGGEISVQSAEQQGAHFTITLPALEAEEVTL